MYRGLFLLVLPGLASCLSQGWQGQQKRRVHDNPAALEQEGLSRRSSLGVLASLSVGLLTGSSSALAFDNKISNKYDDRPKRRGPKVSIYRCTLSHTRIFLFDGVGKPNTLHF